MTTETGVCLIDFCGRFGPIYPWQVWADYDPVTQLVHFGGEWFDVPPVLCELEPNDKEVEALENYANWFIGIGN